MAARPGEVAARMDALEDADQDEVRHHRRAADRDERQRDARDRSDAHGHTYVHEDLEEEREHEPARDDGAVQVSGDGDDPQPPPDDEQVEQEQDRAADEAALLGERREREVGRVLGQVVEPRLARLDDATPRRGRRSRPR